MSLYEFLDLLFTVIIILIDLISRLRRRRIKGTEEKNSPPSVSTTVGGQKV